MKHLKVIGLAAVAAMSLAAFLGAGSASATTFEETEVTKNSAVTITMSQGPENSLLTQPTGGGSLANTCKKSHVHWTTTTFTGPDVSGPVASMSFTECKTEKVEVVKPGSLDITWISGTTNGTVTSTGTEVKVPSPIGFLNCKTGVGTDIGVLTGVASGNATIDINAILNCGIFLPSSEWKGTWVVTSPHGLGVSA